MLYANSPAVQARVDVYLRKPSVAPLAAPGEPNGRSLAMYAGDPRMVGTRQTLAGIALRELSTTSNPED